MLSLFTTVVSPPGLRNPYGEAIKGTGTSSLSPASCTSPHVLLVAISEWGSVLDQMYPIVSMPSSRRPTTVCSSCKMVDDRNSLLSLDTGRTAMLVLCATTASLIVIAALGCANLSGRLVLENRPSSSREQSVKRNRSPGSSPTTASARRLPIVHERPDAKNS
jgi:hypothetical protein